MSSVLPQSFAWRWEEGCGLAGLSGLAFRAGGGGCLLLGWWVVKWFREV